MSESIYEVEIEITEDLLGTISKNKEVYATYIASKAAEIEQREEEISTVTEIEERGWTGFHTDDKGPFLYDYVVKGFLCESARTLKQFGALKQLQDKFKRYVFVTPRRIRLPQIAEKPLERPLRAMTAQGPRVTVTRSDVVTAGARLVFQVTILDGAGITQKCLEKVLDYGKYMGLGQWRSGGFGRFKVIRVDEV